MLQLIIASFLFDLGNPVSIASISTDTPSRSGRLPGHRSIGELIEIEDHPGIVSIEYNEFHICAGSIISKSTILTTFECTRDTVIGLSVRVGTSSAERGGSTHKVLVMRYHEKYQRFGDKVSNYEALMKVTPCFKFGSTVSPIALRTGKNAVDLYTILKVAGWKEVASNRTMMLRSAKLHVIECPIDFSVTNIVWNRPICAIPHDKDVTEICQGDVGGPIMASGFQVGVVPSAKRCVSSQEPRIFDYVPYHRDWIDANVGIMEEITEETELSTFLKNNIRTSSLIH